MQTQRRSHSAELKVRIIREPIEFQCGTTEISKEFNIHPNLIYKWRKEFIENAETIFTKTRSDERNSAAMQSLETKLRDKDAIISELVAENLKLKKKIFWGDLNVK